MSGVPARLAEALADRYVRPRLVLGILGIAMSGGAIATALFSPQWPYPALLIACVLFGAVAVGWNGVYLAEVARVAKPEQTGMATGGTLFFTFLGILLGLPAFSLVVEATGSYPFGFFMAAFGTEWATGAIVLTMRSDSASLMNLAATTTSASPASMNRPVCSCSPCRISSCVPM